MLEQRVKRGVIMIKIENVEVYGFEHAVRGMRNPKNSWDKSDSYFDEFTMGLGEKDLQLAETLSKAGTDHGKFLRMITVWCDITASQTFWAEFDTYKVGTVKDSCSKMHTIHIKPFDIDDFDHEGIDDCGFTTIFKDYLHILEYLRLEFNMTGEKKYWRALIEMLPMGFHLKATVSFNYAVLRNMYHARQNHKLDEWKEFCKWVESLSYSELITEI